MTTSRPWVRMILRPGGDDLALETFIDAMRFAGFISQRRAPEGYWVITYRARSVAAAQSEVTRLTSFGVNAEMSDDPNAFTLAAGATA